MFFVEYIYKKLYNMDIKEGMLMKYSELDTSKLSDSKIYDIVMSGIKDYSKEEVNDENNPDLLIVLGASPIPMKARIVKMMHLYKKGFGKYVLLTGGDGWHKLFTIEKRKFKNDIEKSKYISTKKKKYKSMKKALHKTIPEELKPGINSNKHGKSLYKYMRRKIQENLNSPETDIGYKMIKSCKDIIRIDDDKIFFEPDSKNTIENMKNSKELIDNLVLSGKIPEVKRIMIITSVYHCKRAILSFKKYFPDTEVMACPSTNDITEKGSKLDKESLMKNPFFINQFKKELNAIVSYTRNGSIADGAINIKDEEKQVD